jgi:hypothetical protein
MAQKDKKGSTLKFSELLTNPAMDECIGTFEELEGHNKDVLLGISNIPLLINYALQAPHTHRVSDTVRFAVDLMAYDEVSRAHLAAMRKEFTETQLALIFAGIYNYINIKGGREATSKGGGMAGLLKMLGK